MKASQVSWSIFGGLAVAYLHSVCCVFSSHYHGSVHRAAAAARGADTLRSVLRHAQAESKLVSRKRIVRRSQRRGQQCFVLDADCGFDYELTLGLDTAGRRSRARRSQRGAQEKLKRSRSRSSAPDRHKDYNIFSRVRRSAGRFDSVPSAPFAELLLKSFDN